MPILPSEARLINSACHLFCSSLPIRAPLISIKSSRVPVDPSVEFARVRNALTALEAYIYGQSPTSSRPPISNYPSEVTPRQSIVPQPSAYDFPSSQSPDAEGTLHEKDKSEDVDMASAPGMLGQQASGGLYAGPTSAMSHLHSVGHVPAT